MMFKSIYFFGAGAIGGLIGGYLTEEFGKQRIFLIDKDKEHIDAIRQRDLRLIDIGNKKQNLHYIDVNILTPDQVSDDDLENVVLCTKTYSNNEVLSRLNNNMNVLILQNGYDERTVQQLPDAVRGIEFGFGAKIRYPGVVYNAVKGKYVLGKLNSYQRTDLDVGQDSEINFWATILNQAGIKTQRTNNLEGYLWSKLLINSALNSVSAITGYSLSELIRNENSREVFKNIYREGYSVVRRKARKLGNFIGPPKLANAVFKYQKLSDFILNLITTKFGDVESSMLQDTRKGRQTEIDWINREIIKLGFEYNIETPLNTQIYLLVKEIEQGRQKISPENIFKIN